MTEHVTIHIYRGTPKKQYWESYCLEIKPGMNVISCLMEIQQHPVTSEGKKVTPIVWEDGCLEEVCGSCSMLVNGRPRQACTALIRKLMTKNNDIRLAPLTKFPLIRDLRVDRTVMFDNLKRVNAWIDVDGYFDRGEGPKIAQKKQDIRYTLSTCMTCGCCSEACPQVTQTTSFVGPAAISQVRLFNMHPTGDMNKRKRLTALMDEEVVLPIAEMRKIVCVFVQKKYH